jgi:hypothetical protein
MQRFCDRDGFWLILTRWTLSGESLGLRCIEDKEERMLREREVQIGNSNLHGGHPMHTRNLIIVVGMVVGLLFAANARIPSRDSHHR